MNWKLEICCYNLQSCMNAALAGAHRVELCADPAGGGTTPSFGVIKTVKEKIGIDVYPIIRPRGGDFLYSDDEYRIMQKDIAVCKELGCEGVVMGMLMADGSVDKKRCSKLVEQAYPMGVTFHRAFDRALNPFEALEDIIEAGCERILTSGQRPAAMEGTPLLDELVRQADDRVIIMPGSGVRSSNILHLAQHTGAVEFHSSAQKDAGSDMTFINGNMNESLHYPVADRKEIENMLHQLNQYFNNPVQHS